MPSRSQIIRPKYRPLTVPGNGLVARAWERMATTSRRGRAFDPLATPNLVALWMAPDATDNGTTLTIPNRVSGGVPATSTGGGRAVIDPTGLDGISQGIDFTSATVGLSANIGAAITGSKQLTVICFAQDPSTTAGRLWTYNSGVQNASLNSNGLAGRVFQSLRVATGGNRIVNSRGRDLVFPRACIWRADIDAATEDYPLWLDGVPTPVASASGPTDTPGTFGSGTFWIGTSATGTLPLRGRIGAVAVIRRAITDEEATQWTTWLRAQFGFSRTFDVMWVGDSIQANSNVTYAQWRKVLWDEYEAAGDGMRFFRPVGPFSPAQPTWPQDFCMCQGGTTIPTHEGYLATFEVGTRYVPDIVPICLGTVDAVTVDAATINARMSSFIDALRTRVPNALIVLKKIVPRTTGDAAQARVADWNNNYFAPLVVAKQALGYNIIGDTVLHDLSPYTYVEDPVGLHPDLAMSTPMGEAMYPRLRAWAGV